LPPNRARRSLGATRARFTGSWVEDLALRLKALDIVSSITLFGASVLLSALPLIVILSSLASHRIDTDLSRHIGLDAQGARIVKNLFRASPVHSAGPVVSGLIVGLAGTVAAVSGLQVIYERAFGQQHRGLRDSPRLLLWAAAALGVLILEGIADTSVRAAVGPVIMRLLGFGATTIFFWWTMHFLLAGRVPWRNLIRPALLTALFWLGLALFSSLYFSSAVVTDSRLYGEVGAVFSFLIWFIAIGAVLALGAAGGAVWQERAAQRTLRVRAARGSGG